MTDGPPITAGKRSERADRNERLARALRENLRRRKEQARERQPPSGEPPANASVDKEPPA